MRYLPLLILLFVAGALWAQDDEPSTGYRIVHPDGTVEFTDDPNAGGKEIELRSAPTVKTYTPPKQKPASKYAAPPPKFTGYTEFSVSHPQPEQTIWYIGEKVPVTVHLVPKLQPGHKVVITLDGEEVASGEATSFPLEQIERGTHAVGAVVVDQTDKILISAESVTFYLRKRSSITH